jgi:DNA-binding winged helix-turn-helix (wHTH) protein
MEAEWNGVEKRFVEFGPFRVDLAKGVLLRDGTPVAITPKAFETLARLIAEPGQLVTKAELVESVWPDTIVEENNLTQCISALRRALGNGENGNPFIVTVPKRGYRLAAEVRSADAAAAPERARGARSETPTCRLVWGRREIALDPGENLIGRARASVVWIDDESVSRRHARIVVGDSGVTLEDLGSKNGTFRCGTKIADRVRLADQDTIRIGPASMVFRIFTRTGPTASTVEDRTSS